MRIFLDENMPRKLLAALVAEGHEVDSVKSLQLQGIDNGALYQFASSNYDLCFTRDAEFSRRVRSSSPAARLKRPSRNDTVLLFCPHVRRLETDNYGAA